MEGKIIISFIIKRVIQSIFVIFLMSLIVFLMINFVGDPVDMLVNPESLPEEIDRVEKTLVWISQFMFNTGSFYKEQ